MDTTKQHPRCFGSREDFELWLDSPNTETHLQSQHCTDCLPSFKMRMAACGRCEHPETVFAFEPHSFDGEDGVEITGHWAAHHPQKFQIVRFVKPVGRPRKVKPKPDPVAEESYWQKQERLMRQRMGFGR